MSARAVDVRVEIEGLRELRRDLRRLDGDGEWKAAIRGVNLRAANKVAATARQSMLGASSPRAGHVAAGTIKGLAGQSSASVSGGLASVPWYMGHEMGSARYRQFPRRAANGSHHIYPAIKRDMPAVIDMYRREMDLVVRRFFP